MIFENIKKLVQYGIDTGLTPECERIYTTNLLLELFDEDNYEDSDISGQEIDLEMVLNELLDEAVQRGKNLNFPKIPLRYVLLVTLRNELYSGHNDKGGNGKC